MVEFTQPWVLLLLPPVLYLDWRWRREKTVPVFEFFPGEAGPLTSPGTLVLSGLPIILRMGTLVALLIALAGPGVRRVGLGAEDGGAAVMAAMDLSGSMLEEDMGGRSRLQVAREELHRFVEGLEGVQVGLLTFAGEAVTRVPLSIRHERLLEVLERLQPSEVDDGTALGNAVGIGAIRLQSVPARSRALVILTDGVNNSGAVDPLTAARMAHELGIRVFCIGVGGGSGGSGLDEALLSRMASSGGGAYYRAEDRAGLGEVLREIGDGEVSPVLAGVGVFQEKHGAVLMLAALLLLSEGLIRVLRLGGLS
jgi:Ca-activated chloride channel family protein